MTRTFRSFLLVIISATLAAAELSAQTTSQPDALLEYRSGRYESAVAITLEELREDPRRMDAYAVLCWSLIRLQRYQESLDYANTGLGIDPTDARLIEVAGEALFYLNRNSESLEYMERYLALDPPGNAIQDAYYFMGEIFMRWGEFHKADIAFSAATYIRSNSGYWFHRLGRARELAGRLNASREAYERSLELDPGNAVALAGLERIDELE